MTWPRVAALAFLLVGISVAPARAVPVPRVPQQRYEVEVSLKEIAIAEEGKFALVKPKTLLKGTVVVQEDVEGYMKSLSEAPFAGELRPVGLEALITVQPARRGKLYLNLEMIESRIQIRRNVPGYSRGTATIGIEVDPGEEHELDYPLPPEGYRRRLEIRVKKLER